MLSRGFTLFEILIVLAIVGILFAVGYPIYSDHMTNTFHKMVKLELLHAASAMQTYFDLHQTYQTASFQNMHLSPQILNGRYRLSIEEQTKSTFLVTASSVESGQPPMSIDQEGKMDV
ncbi:MAG: hypothetical protein A3F17_01720 [Gammaproteobacteria bacterium RIFCSPHIGHO2_12_FULL_41_15]|nr:MAG: hypothetical protein A3F17_01720 [Gammaproteobacteria bacterium RIFCSPHIGHO2_12_FULL_41_15]